MIKTKSEILAAIDELQLKATTGKLPQIIYSLRAVAILSYAHHTDKTLEAYAAGYLCGIRDRFKSNIPPVAMDWNILHILKDVSVYPEFDKGYSAGAERSLIGDEIQQMFFETNRNE